MVTVVVSHVVEAGGVTEASLTGGREVKETADNEDLRTDNENPSQI